MATKVMESTALVVSTEAQADAEMQGTVTNSSLLSLMNGEPTDTTNVNEREDRSPVKNKPRKLGTVAPSKTSLATKQIVKSAL